MAILKKDIRNELIWLFVTPVLTVLLISILWIYFYRLIEEAVGIKIPLYIPIGNDLIGFVFFIVAFWLYVIRQSIYRFKKQFGNVVLFLATVFSLLTPSLLATFVAIQNYGLIIYPPLSAIPQEIPEADRIRIDVYVEVFKWFQIVVLVFTGIMIGMRIKQQNIKLNTNNS